MEALASRCFLFGNPAGHLSSVALWLCVPGSLRVCPFGGMSVFGYIKRTATNHTWQYPESSHLEGLRRLSCG